MGYLMLQLILETIIWFQVFLTKANNLYTFMEFQIFLFNPNNLYAVIWFQIFQ